VREVRPVHGGEIEGGPAQVALRQDGVLEIRGDEARPLLERVKFLTPSGPYGKEAAKLLAILP